MNGEGRLVRPRMRFERDFTQLPNTWLRDENLSLKARGLLAMLMTHSEGWSVTIKSLAAAGQDGRAAIQTAVNELEQAGYLQRQQTRDNRGRLGHVWWEISDPAERRDYRGTPLLDFPSAENQPTGDEVDYPSAENQPTVEEQVKEHLPRSLKSPTIDARASKEDALTGDNRRAATESPAEYYQRLLRAKCPLRRDNKPHVWESSGYCSTCGAKKPSAAADVELELVEA